MTHTSHCCCALTIILQGLMACFGAAEVHAASLTLESATMGPAAQASGAPISASQYIGWRFLLTKKTAVSHVGGHIGGINGNLFAAIVSLSATDAMPQGAPFNETEVVASTAFVATLPTGDILTPLAKVLDAGAYALVIGSGKFNAAGTGLVPYSGQTNVSPTLPASYISWRQALPGRLEWTAGSVDKVRLVVVGSETAGAADFNFDSRIDGADLSIWKANAGGAGTGGTASGDATSDGRVDGADFLLWQRTVTPLPTSASLIPEPNSLVIALIGLLAGYYRGLRLAVNRP